MTERALVATAALAVGAGFLLTPAFCAEAPTACVFKNLAGLPCPGCGLGRSFVALAHADPAAAFAHHAFGPFAFAACCAVLALAACERLTGVTLVGDGALRRLRIPAAAVAAAWVAWAVVRGWQAAWGQG